MQILLDADLTGQIAHDMQNTRESKAAGNLAELNYRLLAEAKAKQRAGLQDVDQIPEGRSCMVSVVLSFMNSDFC